MSERETDGPAGSADSSTTDRGATGGTPDRGAGHALTRRQRLYRQLKRSAVRAVHSPRPVETETPPPPVAPPAEDREGLLTRMNPFSIGFFGTLGAMVAYTLWSILGSIQSILLLVVVSLFIALGLNPLVEMLSRHRLRRGIGVGVVSVGVLGVIVLAAWAILPVLSEQITGLITSSPSLLSNLRDNAQVARLDERFQIIQKATQFLTSGQLINALFGGLLGAGKVLASALGSAIVTLVLTFYFLASLPAIKNTIYRLAPASRRPRVRYLADESFRRIGGYLSGMFIVVLCSGTCSFIFTSILGLEKYALALATMGAMLAFIPLIGTNIAMVLIAFVAWSVLGPVHALITVVYYLLYQQLEAYVIQPRVMRRSVDVPGPLVIVAALAGGVLLGIVGALIAIPITAALLLLYREVLLPKLDRS